MISATRSSGRGTHDKSYAAGSVSADSAGGIWAKRAGLAQFDQVPPGGAQASNSSSRVMWPSLLHQHRDIDGRVINERLRRDAAIDPGGAAVDRIDSQA